MLNYSKCALRKEASWISGLFAAGKGLGAKALPHIAPNLIQSTGKGIGAKVWAGTKDFVGRPAWWTTRQVGSLMPFMAMQWGYDKLMGDPNKMSPEELAMYTKLRQQHMLKDLALYGGSSVVGASLGYTMSDKNKARNAIIGGVLAPTATFAAKQIYDKYSKG